MNKLITKDGSVTYHNKQYDEAYHSVSGAVEEAFKKFVEPCNIEKYAKKGFVNVLDVCFGLGYNSAALIDKVLEKNPDCIINIVGLEIDNKIMRRIRGLNPGFKNYRIIKRVVHNNYYYSKDNLKIMVLLGDARETLKDVEQKFDIIFHDPFSPKKCPELWTADFFKELKKHIANDGLLTTYSCARIVRENLKKAGFSVTDGPCVGRRAPSTIAKPC